MLHRWTLQAAAGEGSAGNGIPASSGGAAGNDQEFDVAAIEAVLSLDPDGELGLMRELVDTFAQDAEQKIAGIRQKLQAGDAAGIHALTHQLKSSAGTLGLSRVSRLSREIDDDARKGGLGRAAELIEPLAQAVVSGTAWLASHLK